MYLDEIPIEMLLNTGAVLSKLPIIFANHAKLLQTTVHLFYQCGISIFHDKQWNCTHPSNLHPITQQPMAWLKGRFKHSKSEYLESRVAQFKRKFLFMYRVTPHSVTGVPPSELLHGRHLRCRLDNWYPDISQRVGNLQDKQKLTHDKASSQRSFSVGDLVFAENFAGTAPRWLPGAVVMVTGPLSYKSLIGPTVRRHVDSIRKRYLQQMPPQGEDAPRPPEPQVDQDQSQEVDPLSLPDVPTLPPNHPLPPRARSPP